MEKECSPYRILCHGYSVPKTVCPCKAKTWQARCHASRGMGLRVAGAPPLPYGLFARMESRSAAVPAILSG